MHISLGQTICLAALRLLDPSYFNTNPFCSGICVCRCVGVCACVCRMIFQKVFLERPRSLLSGWQQTRNGTVEPKHPSVPLIIDGSLVLWFHCSISSWPWMQWNTIYNDSWIFFKYAIAGFLNLKFSKYRQLENLHRIKFLATFEYRGCRNICIKLLMERVRSNIRRNFSLRLFPHISFSYFILQIMLRFNQIRLTRYC